MLVTLFLSMYTKREIAQNVDDMLPFNIHSTCNTQNIPQNVDDMLPFKIHSNFITRNIS